MIHELEALRDKLRSGDDPQRCADELTMIIWRIQRMKAAESVPAHPKVLSQADIERIASKEPELAVYYCVCGGQHQHTLACRDNMGRLNDYQRQIHELHQKLAAESTPAEPSTVPQFTVPEVKKAHRESMGRDDIDCDLLTDVLNALLREKGKR